MSFLALVALVLLPHLTLAANRPVGGDRLSLRDPGSTSRRTVRFKAARDPAVDPGAGDDPRIVGATLEIAGQGAGDGASGPRTLDAQLWFGLGNPSGSKGYRFLDRDRQVGVRTVVLKRRNGTGTLALRGGGALWPYAVTQPQGIIDVRLTVGSDVYCASFGPTDLARNEPGRVFGRDAAPPACCGTAVCGDGVAECPEECDDGNASGGDGCSAACQLEDTSALCDGVPSVSGTALDTVLVASGLEAPVHVTAPRLDPNRLFVVEQPGRIRVIKNGVLLAAPFLAIEDIVNYGGEQGLLSVAFHPDYETNGRFFVYYVNNDGDLVIARYEVSGGNPDDANEASAHVLLTVPHPTFGNHNGGNLNFGPDGFLYAGTGDGGAGCDPSENAQNDLSMLGKLLRIDVAAETTTIWAKGLRNPWRFSFDRGTGDLYIADVGQNHWEEIDVVAAPLASGVNYGWDFYEGRHCSSDPPSSCGDPCPAPGGLTMPVLEYDHAQGCSITGGFVYRGCAMPDLAGTYFYSDICTPFIKSFNGVSGGDAQNLMDHTVDLDPPGGLSIGGVSSFGEDARGEHYVVDYVGGEVFKIVPGS